MNNLIVDTNDMQFSLSALLVYGMVYFFVTVISIGTASPSGPFIPMVLCGAAWGRALGLVMNTRNVQLYAVMGGAASLTGFTRMPMAITSMFLEVTGNTVYSAPLFIVNTIARD